MTLSLYFGLKIKIASTKSLWMELKCGQISIQHTKVFIESSFSCNMRSKEFLSAIIWKRKKECLKSRTDVVEQQNKSFSNKCPLDPSRLQLMFLRYWKAEKFLHPDVKRLVQVSKLTLESQRLQVLKLRMIWSRLTL